MSITRNKISKKQGIQWDAKIKQAIFQAIVRSNGNGFTSDDVRKILQDETDVSPYWISRRIGTIIRAIHGLGGIHKSNTFRISKRSQRPLPVYNIKSN